jgi:4-hydroxy-3-methylbut-2-enyl diphosphate reductase
VVVIGSENSSNTVALEQVAVAFGCPRVIRVNDADDLPDDLAGIVGVTAGASAPEALVTAVVGRLAPRGGIERAPVTLEEEYFPPPPELRELLRGLAGALSLMNRVPSPGRGAGPDPADPATLVLAEDRTTAAADVLERLAG